MVFVCNKCGICCKGLRAVHDLAPEQLMELKNSTQQKNRSGPVYIFPSPDMFTFFMFEQEVEPLRRAAKDKGIKLSIRPHTALYDDYANTWVVLTWFLDHDDCPFLTDTGCSVYDIRPLACKAFPVQPRLFKIEGGVQSLYDTLAEKCPLIDPKSYSGRMVGDVLPEFGECTVAAEIFSSLYRYQREMIAIGITKSMLIKVHKGGMPADREHYEPAMEYLSKLGILKKDKLEIWNRMEEIVRKRMANKDTAL